MQDYWRDRIKGIAYNMSGGIRFSLAVNLTNLDLRCDDLYADDIETVYMPFGQCDVMISPINLDGAFIISSYDIIGYINI